LCCSSTSGSESRTADPDVISEEFPDDFQSETDEDEYNVDWNRDGVNSDAVDSRRCELFAIAEENLPDLMNEAHQQSWTDTQKHRKLTDELEEYERWHSSESDQFRCQYGQQWRRPNEEEEDRPDNERNRETPWTGDTNFDGEEPECLEDDPDDRATLHSDDQSGFEDKAPEMFHYTMSRSFGMDGLSMHREHQVDCQFTENISTYNPDPQTCDKLNDLEGADRRSENGLDRNKSGSVHEEMGQDQADEDGEVAEWKNGVMYEGVEDEIDDDDIAERCAWNSDNQDFITLQDDLYSQDGDFEIHLEHRSPQKSSGAEMSTSSEDQQKKLYTQEERFSDLIYQDQDPHVDHCWNGECLKSTDFALPTSSIDVFHVEDSGHEIICDRDHSQPRIIGRRWTKTPAGSGTIDATNISDGSKLRDQAVDQSAAENDTLPRRGHMKSLLAQWRELEQRRKDEELIEMAASNNSDRSRRPAVRTPWFKAPKPDQSRALASTRSQSCGPVSRRPAKVPEFDGSSSWRNVNADDGEESEMTFDRVAIREKFERLDAEAQRSTIFNRKKVELDSCVLHVHCVSKNAQTLKAFKTNHRF